MPNKPNDAPLWSRLPRFRPQPHRFALESRQLFDGASFVEAAVAVDAHHAEPAAIPVAQPVDRAVPETRVAEVAHGAVQVPATAALADRAIHVVDASVHDWQQIIAALPPGSEVIVLDAQSSGVAQLAQALAGRSDIRALSIISHGAAGQITLGSATVTADNLDTDAAAWRAIGASLAADGDILLYGCDVAGAGDGFLQRLASLTGADVAASTNATGATRLGGDWTLEASVGRVEARAFADAAYDGLLAAPTIATTAVRLEVAEPSTLNDPGADQGQLTGWSLSDDGSGNVTVTAFVDGNNDNLPDGTIGMLSVGAGGVRAASLSFTGTAAAATAWVNSLVFSATDTELGNTAASGFIRVTVTDSEAPALSATRSLAVSVTPSNDPTVIGNVTQAVSEIGGTVLTMAALGATDSEVAAGSQTPDQIVYAVKTIPSYGYVTLNGVRLGVDSVFTQQDVIDGDVVYVHTATGANQNATDSFSAEVNDGATPAADSARPVITLTVTPFNQLPSVTGSGTILEGQPANANSAGVPQSVVGDFLVASGGGDDPDAALIVHLTALPADGTLYFTGTAVVNGVTQTFTNHAITAGEIATGSGFVFAYGARGGLTYANAGNRDRDGLTPSYPYADGFNVTVTDAGGGTGVPASTADTRIVINVRPVNDDPVLVSTPTPAATVTPAGDGSGPYVVTLTSAMLNATDVDSSNGRLTFVVTAQGGLDQGVLLLNGHLLPVGSVFTMADVLAGRVQYAQTGTAVAGDTDRFQFQVVDNTVGVVWNADGTSLQRIGGVYDNGGTPGVTGDDTLHAFTFTINLAPTFTPNGGGFGPGSRFTEHFDSGYAGTAPDGISHGTVSEGGTIGLVGTTTGGVPTDFTTTPGLSYTADGAEPEQVIYTVLGFGDAGSNWNGALQRLDGSTWVDLNVYDTFTQADLNAGAIRFQHDGASEDFQSTVRLSVSAGLLVGPPSNLQPDHWETTFTFYVTPVNDAPVATGSSNTVIAEGETVGITIAQLQISDPDDANSESYLEASGTGQTTLAGGGNNYAYNNDASGANALRIVVDTLPAAGSLQVLLGGVWTNLAAGDLLDASLLTGDAATTGLRYVNDGSEVRSTSFQVHAVDRWGAASGPVNVDIVITNVDDAPLIAQTPNPPDPGPPGATANDPLTVVEGGYGQISNSLLRAYDPDSSSIQLQYRITGVPAHGNVAYSADGVNFQILGAGSSFTQEDVDSGRIYYLNSGDESDGAVYANGDPRSDRFTFTLSDGYIEKVSSQFWIYVTPANDAPVLAGPGGPVAIDSAVPADNPVAGFSVADSDLDVLIAGEGDYLQVTVRLLDSAGAAFAAAAYAGVAIGSSTLVSSGVAVVADKDGANDYLTLRGTRGQINAALAGLNVTFSSDRDAIYRVQVIADDRLRDGAGVLTAGANGGPVNDTPDPAVWTVPVPATEFDWYGDAVPGTGDIVGNISAAAVSIFASSVNDPAVIGAPAAATVYEDQPSYIGGAFVVSDAESAAFGTPISVTFSVPGGSLGIGATGAQVSVSAGGGRTVTVQGDETGTLVLTGLASDIQALINSGPGSGLTYHRSALNANDDANGADAGDITLRMSVDDAGSRFGDDAGAGSVANVPADLLVALTIVPVNDAPVVTLAAGVVAGTPLFLLGGTTPTAVSGFNVDDLDITNDIANGNSADVAQGEADFLQVTVRITGTDGVPLASGAYAGAVVIESSNSVAGLVVDSTADGTDSALVIRGTHAQVQSYLDGLQVALTGPLANANTAYRVQVIADDRLRDSGGVLAGTVANGGENAVLPAGGTVAVPTAAIDPYSSSDASLAALANNVSAAYRTIFPSAINDPAHITATPVVVNEAGGTVALNNVDISDVDAESTSVLVATVSVPANFVIQSIGGSGGAVSATGGTSITITGTLAEINSRIDTIVVQLPDPDGAGVAGIGDWNGNFTVTVVVDDNGNSGARPATLAAGDNATTGTFAYEDLTGSHLLTTRTFQVTVNPTNDAPVLAGTAGDRAVAEFPNAANTPGVPEVRLVTAGTASITDVDLATTPGLGTFGAGNISVTLGSPIAGDVLLVAAGAPLPPQFSVSGGTGGAALVITYGVGTTAAEINAVIERLAYRSDSDNPTAYGASPTRSFGIVVNDGNNLQPGGATAGGPVALNSNNLTGRVVITAVNDPPVARDDARTIAEDAATITGNVISAIRVGEVADSDVDNILANLRIAGFRTGTEAAGTGVAGSVGVGLAGSYGTLVLNASGSYNYALDNTNPAVNALKSGVTLTEYYTYTLSDGAGGFDTAQLTITINGRTDGAPVITPVDGNGGAAGQTDVLERGLTDGLAGADTSERNTGVVSIGAADGLVSVTVGGTVLTAAQLQALGNTPVSITTPLGTLVLTGFTNVVRNGTVPISGDLQYTFTLAGAINQPGVAQTMEPIALSVLDAGAATANGTLSIRIVNDVPTATADTAAITEDASPGTVGGSVFGNDRIGADGAAVGGPVTAMAFGATAGSVGSSLVTAYGAIVLNADGSYVYTLDNSNAAVNALKDGQSLTEVVNYTITDGDGNSSASTLTITISGHTDGSPTITPVDGNGAAAGQATVYEAGLTPDGPVAQSSTATGTISVSAPDGLQALNVGGTLVSTAQLAALSAGSPVSIDTGEGTLVLTGFTADTRLGGLPAGVPTTGTLSYSYTLKGPQTHTSSENTDTINLTVIDLAGTTNSGSLDVTIVNDVPTATADTAAITEDASPGTVGGSVFGNDRIGADGAAVGGPVTAMAFGATAGSVGSSLVTAYGAIVLNADGSYVYTLDNSNAAVNALKDGQSLSEVVNYTITDGDGNTSASTLTITINGHTDGTPTITPVDGNGGTAGQATVYEAGLTPDGPVAQSSTATGTISVSALDGLQALNVGGTLVSTAQLAALSAGSPVSIDTGEGTLVLTGFTADTRLGGVPAGVPTTGTLSYSYTLKGPQTHTSSENTDTINLTVIDLAGATNSGSLDVTIVNDVPTATADTAAITEDASPGTVGGSVFGNDRIGADGAAVGGPVTAMAFGATAGSVGSSLAATYGAIVLNADGSYVYTLDNNNVTVNALVGGQSLSEVFNYTITDGDGNSSATTLTVTISGHTDGSPTITPVDGNGAAAGQATVYEAGLTPDGPAGQSHTATGAITIYAPDGLQSVTVGGTTLSAAELSALTPGAPVRIDTGAGTLSLTGYAAGTLSYSYTLKGSQTQTAGESTDTIALSVTDLPGFTNPGTLSVTIVNDVPTATADTAAITEDASPGTVGGSVFGNDRIGADGAAVGGPVTEVAFGATAGSVGSSLVTAYGAIVLNADGSYVYTLDNNNAAVNALKDGENLSEVVNYTITDGDGNSSATTLTVTINGHTDGTPTITPVDGNGGAAGQTDVLERGLTDGLAGADTSERNTGVVSIGAADGLVSVTVGGTVLTAAQLQALGNTPVSITTPLGTLVLTGFTNVVRNGTVPISGDLQYTFTLAGAINQPGVAQTMEPIALSVLDAGAATANGTLSIRIVNDVPTATADTAAITEDASPGTVGGSVFGNDRIGADGAAVGGPVTAMAFGATAGSVGSSLVTAYGAIVLNADGSYVYTLDNSNAAVNALKDGQSLTEVVNYTITDGDGNSSASTLTITISGHTDGSPTITPVDGNGAAAGQATVYEAGLTPDGPVAQSSTATGTISVSAPDGLQALNVGGTLVSTAQLAALSAGSPVSIDTGEGTLVLTGFTADTRLGGLPAGVPTTGTLSYSYTLKGPQTHTSSENTDTINLTVIDLAGTTNSGSLDVTIVNDVPTATADTAAITEDASPGTVGGSVFGNDRIGADGAAVGGPVTAMAFGATVGSVGSSLATAYGAIVLNADGSYVYTLDNNNAAVNALKDGQSLTEVVNYTITDGDGNTSATTLTVTISGHTDGSPTITPVDGNGGAAGQATVYEAGLTPDGPVAQSSSATGTISVSALDGLQALNVGGTLVSTAQLAALSAGSPVSIDTGEGTLVLTGFTADTRLGGVPAGVPTTGTLSYSYTLKGPQTQTASESTDAINLTVIDLAGATNSGTLSVTIVNDVPTATADTAAITEDASPGTVGGSVFGNDRIGADGAAPGGPVTAMAFGATAGSVGSSLAATYGAIVLNADGSYVYTLDNNNVTVNALVGGQSLSEVFNYTITDGDGNSSATTLTVTISGHTDGTPTITPVDGNGGAAGQATVYETGLTPDGPAGQSHTATGAITIYAPDGLQSVTVGGTTLSAAELSALTPGAPVRIDTGAGTLSLTGYAAGTLSYSYTLKGSQTQTAGESTDTIALSVTDLPGFTNPGTLSVTIVNDVPTATADTAAITEDASPATVGGSVFGNDRIGADGAAPGGPVTAMAFGATAGSVGSSLVTAYGAIVLNADGSYVYTLDNNNAAVNALKDGENLSEVVNYTITDGDGNSSATTLTVTINGHTDGTPTITPVDGNGAADGQTDVLERGLTDGLGGPDASERNTGVVSIGAADGLVSVTVGGTVLTAAQLQALGNTPVSITTPLGTLVLTGLTNVVRNGTVPISGELQYTFTLAGAINQPGVAQTMEPIALSVLDAGAATANGILALWVLDDGPTALADAALVDTELPHGHVSGNVVGVAGKGPADVADRIGADATSAPVTGIAFDGRAGVVGGAALAGHYGALQIAADGSYRYAVDDNNPKVASLDPSRTLTELFTYTITDADGSTSSATLTITIKGHTPPVLRTGDDFRSSDFPPAGRQTRQTMQPALFVQLAVRESQRISQTMAADITARVTGGVQSFYQDDRSDENIYPRGFGIVPAMDPAEHVGRDGVAFSQSLVRDVEITLAQRGLDPVLQGHGGALAGDFLDAQSERISIATPVHIAAPESAGVPPLPPIHATENSRPRSFSERLALAAGERGPVRDRNPYATREALRVKVPAAPR